jgi:hypothetical protein
VTEDAALERRRRRHGWAWAKRWSTKSRRECGGSESGREEEKEDRRRAEEGSVFKGVKRDLREREREREMAFGYFT